MSLHHGWLDRCSGKSVPISDGPEKGQPQPDRQLEKASDALGENCSVVSVNGVEFWV